MKNLVLILFLIIINPTKAQDYTPLLDDRNEWHLISCYLGDCIRDIYYTNGDSIVNGQNHKVLDGYHYISRTFLLRENIEERKVYLKTILNDHIEEYLLYDFNLDEGDIINLYNPITPFPQDGGEFRLDSIRLKPILEEQTGKFYYFSPTIENTQSAGYLPVWVEGLGSLSLITAPGGHPDYNGVGKVSCFFKNGNLFYFDGEMTEECESVMSVATLEETKSDLEFAITTNSIGILKTEKKINKIEIYDLSGKKSIAKNILSNNQVEIDLTGLKKGVYILLAYDKKRTYSISFVLK